VNNLSTLPYETQSAHCASAIIELFKKETPELIPPRLWPPNSPDLNPVDNLVWEILQEKLYKKHITDLEPSTMPLTNDCRSDDMIQLGQLRCQSLFQFVQISDACFVILLLQVSTHCNKWIQI